MKVWIEQGTIWELEEKTHEGFRQVVKMFKKKGRDVFVMSGGEGDHLPDSLHYLDKAWDQRTKGFKKADFLKALPGGDKIWDVIMHVGWCHIERDPKVTDIEMILLMLQELMERKIKTIKKKGVK